LPVRAKVVRECRQNVARETTRALHDGTRLGRIGRVRARWPLLVGLLVYITLDLSLPSMPGAFVFDAEDSVESVQLSRSRDAGEAGPSPAPARDAGSAVEHDAHVARLLARLVRSSRQLLRTPAELPRATTASAPPSEDPH
jgi:hypothetical protein